MPDDGEAQPRAAETAESKEAAAAEPASAAAPAVDAAGKAKANPLATVLKHHRTLLGSQLDALTQLVEKQKELQAKLPDNHSSQVWKCSHV